MKRFIHLIVVPLFFIAVASTAQKPLLPSRFSVVLSPALVSVDGIYLTVQPGLQYQKGHWAVGSEAAFLLYEPGTRLTNIHYLRLGAELRRFLFTKPRTKDYVSLQVNYTWQSFTDTSYGWYYKVRGGHQFSYTTASINAPVFAVALKIGQEYRLSNKLFIDLFGGVGSRTTYTSYEHVENEQEIINYGVRDFFTFPSRAYRYNQTITRLHLLAGFRLGYSL